MQLVTYTQRNAPPRLGVVKSDRIIDVARLGDAYGIALPHDMSSFIDLGPEATQCIAALVQKSEQSQKELKIALPKTNADLLAPIERPRKNIFGIGLNYSEHVEESSKKLDTSKELPEKPVVFTKPPTAVIGPGKAIEHNEALTQQLDWEVELAVIIGQRAKRVSTEDAMDYVFGYSIIIDVSARDCRRSGQWLICKGQDTYAPFGPCIVTADELTDPHNLDLSLKVNKVTKQNSNTKFLLFDIPTLVSDISQGITLEPGDIIATGTPSGVGAGRDPQEWMWPGDVIEAAIEGIGTIRHPVVAV